MKTATKVWVPGEACEDGLVVTDADTGEELLVQQGERGKLTVPVKAGRFVNRPAVRAVLLQTTERGVLVRLPDGRKLTVRIVAGWQLGDGDGQIPPAEAARSDSAPEPAESVA